jgi:2Fe-2S ferredoxin
MIDIEVTERDGTTRTIAGSTGASLMEVLRDADTGVEGTCGGVCACGTCHVYVSASWLLKLPPKAPDEADMLEALGGVGEVRADSRLACQIELRDELSGLAVEIAPVV